MAKIKPRERDAIIQSLSAGVVPRIGLQHVQVDRKDEINAILTDLDRVSNKGASLRFVIGKYGSGKSFFLNLTRALALEKKFVTVNADITQNVRLAGSNGKSQALYSELIHNLGVRAKPEGGALSSLIEKWISDIDYRLKQQGKGQEEVIQAIHQELKPLQDFVSGYDFALVIGKYYEGFSANDEHLKSSALRWLAGDYTSKLEARQDLGVRNIISDEDIYDYLKLWAHFTRMAGYSGIIVFIDELGIISHGLNSPQARDANYDMLLKIVNDCLQGNVSAIGFFFAGTDDFLNDSRRGIASNEALARRLARNTFKVADVKDFSGPVIFLENLSIEDNYVLLCNIRNVFASGDVEKYLISDKGIEDYLSYCAKTLGSEFYQTPGDMVRRFVSLLSILEQNPNKTYTDILSLGTSEKEAVKETGTGDIPSIMSKKDDDLTSLRL
jgi:hypothetical protein